MGARLIVAGLALAASPALGFDHGHGAWDALLKKHVVAFDGGRASRLDYAGMAKDRGALKAYLAALSAVRDAEFKAWPRNERMAFLINAYNAFTVEKVLTRYPDIRSIWDFGKIFGNPFKDEFFTLLGERRSLDGIEHGMLRPQYREPRVHYAVNCASVGCPMLREEAYLPARLEAQLEEQARRFLSDRSRNRYEPGGGKLQVSRIFDWFAEDFEPRARYFAPYAELLADGAAGRDAVRGGRAGLEFLDYDWSLNDSRSSSRR
ncbi:MAG TPA: DUF547 domain-containing protein [Burkholderiales bacterium]|nr:DUF547 domain-containing protein [Burkholderiales bacterium]